MDRWVGAGGRGPSDCHSRVDVAAIYTPAVGYRLARIGGTDVEFHVSGPANAPSLLVLHPGTPSAATGFPAFAVPAARRGLRLVIYSRPGYGRSTRAEGRSIADEAERTAAIADLLGYRSFFVAGWSGGGPPALACAALLPERVRAVVTLASPAPPEEVGPAYRDLTSPEDAVQVDLIAAGRQAELVPDYEEGAGQFRRMTAHRLATGPFATGRDRLAHEGEGRLGVSLARSMRRAVARGIWGWFDDGVAQSRGWGFRVGDIAVPVVVRQGGLDRLVDPRHGRWLAAAIPGAVLDLRPEEGHGSIAYPFDDVVEQLLGAADGQP